ncbi:MAG: bifunctional [glutamate--ammonia ligase]-adenylyl-L-tyrosine phosphorylase/[glutamate--ammonia-ligase] adenylyltransferase, partial [Lentisphaerae bacterium]|nr:bifunctional [glutamate--ammonia ligase]-adenylyl-L-tyrosine phosphorylase/[glutamate--ammonia-ligase] adenylyltransferase [Lentisphaerota bacterium]
FVAVLPDAEAHYALLLSQPRRLDILLAVFAGSQFLADTLRRYPAFLEWATDPAVLRGRRDAGRIGADLDAFLREAGPGTERLNALRRFRRREMLRIGTRDICLRAPLESVTADLSALADAVIARALEAAWAEADPGPQGARLRAGLCIMALGKLGGGELNYSSDVDLMAVADTEAAAGCAGAEEIWTRVVNRLREALSRHTEEGVAYRVDMRLRPHGTAGPLVAGLNAAARYYAERAALWEIQALVKLRPVAGAGAAGARCLEAARAALARPRRGREVADSVRSMRARAAEGRSGAGRTDIKSGLGGIRDIEFLVQALQLVYAHEDPDLLTGHTLEALRRLARKGRLDPGVADSLAEDYSFLRRTEHFLQILEDRQIHALPRDAAQLTALARRVLGPETTREQFAQNVDAAQRRTREQYERHMKKVSQV